MCNSFGHPRWFRGSSFLGMSRNAYSSSLGPKLEEAVDAWDHLAGIDLHGPEELPIEEWTIPLWRKAADRGLILKAHAGEFGPVSNIEFAIEKLGKTYSAWCPHVSHTN